VKISLSDLWQDTFWRGRGTSDVSRLQSLGRAHATTACLLRDDPQIPVDHLPSYEMFLGEDYGKFVGARALGERFARGYLNVMGRYVASFREHGYDPAKSVLSVQRLDDGRWVMIDGHRRIAIMLALGCGPMIEVKSGDRRFTAATCRKTLDAALPQSPYEIAGRRVLYQPIRGFDSYNAPSRTAQFEAALEAILPAIGDPRGKRILDVGSCFGFFSFGLARLGGLVTGLEIDGQRLAACRQLSAHYDRDWSNPLWVAVPAEDFLAASSRRYDVILMLSVFHCLWRADHRRAINTLRRALQLADQVLLSMDHGGLCNTQSAVGPLLRDHLPGALVEAIGTACGRHLFKIASR